MSKKIPVALFVFDRLRSVERTLQSLMKCPEAPVTPLVIFSDAGYDEKTHRSVAAVREYLKTISGFKSIEIIERSENFYIERNIFEGVSQVLKESESVIVLEDDAIVANSFLKIMNDVLTKYADVDDVGHVASFTYIRHPSTKPTVFFWKYVENTGGGWGTWRKNWEKFNYYEFSNGTKALDPRILKKLALKDKYDFSINFNLSPVPWDICWFYTCLENDWISAQTSVSLLRNIGVLNGTHFDFMSIFKRPVPFITLEKSIKELDLPVVIKEDSEMLDKLGRYFYKINRDYIWLRLLKRLMR